MTDYSALVPEVRQKFLKKYDGSVLDDTYDERDVEWVTEDDRLIKTVIGSFKAKGDVNKAVDLLNDMLLFRAKWEVNDLTKDNIHDYYSESGAMFYQGHDKAGRPILNIVVKSGKRGHLIEDSKKWVAYNLNLQYRKDPSQPITLLYDFLGAGVSNWDIESSKFFAKALNTYFPNVMGCALFFKMSKPLEVVWKTISPFVDEHQSKNTHFCKRSNIQKYVEIDQLLPHMVKDENDNKKK